MLEDSINSDSLREGLEETLIVHRLKIPGMLLRTLSNANTMETANSVATSVLKAHKELKRRKLFYAFEIPRSRGHPLISLQTYHILFLTVLIANLNSPDFAAGRFRQFL